MTGQTVWLASYPKSGNTWLRAVYTSWRQTGPVDINALEGGPIAADRELLDVALGVPTSSMTSDEIDLVRPAVDELVAAEVGGPHLRKIHDAYFRGPDGEPIVSVAATRAALYVIRDPRAVAVSLADHVGRPLDWACRRLADPGAVGGGIGEGLFEQVRQRLGTWTEHVCSWVDDAPFPVEVVRFEDCVEAPVATFMRALRFAGFDAGERSVTEAVEHASFDRLHRAERDQGFRERSHTAGRFFRRGEADSWREELPSDLAARIREDHAVVMARFGYE